MFREHQPGKSVPSFVFLMAFPILEMTPFIQVLAKNALYETLLTDVL